MRKDMGICFAQARQSNASLPVAALVDQFYARLEARGGKRWDSTAALIQLLLKDQA
jgi:3-hydroxyisobutyrate dehydrogenase